MRGQGRGRTADLPLFRCSGPRRRAPSCLVGRCPVCVGGCRRLPTLPSHPPRCTGDAAWGTWASYAGNDLTDPCDKRSKRPTYEDHRYGARPGARGPREGITASVRVVRRKLPTPRARPGLALVELSVVEQRYKAVLEHAAGVPVTTSRPAVLRIPPESLTDFRGLREVIRGEVGN
jgi:hypothetical protein